MVQLGGCLADKIFEVTVLFCFLDDAPAVIFVFQIVVELRISPLQSPKSMAIKSLKDRFSEAYIWFLGVCFQADMNLVSDFNRLNWFTIERSVGSAPTDPIVADPSPSSSLIQVQSSNSGQRTFSDIFCSCFAVNKSASSAKPAAFPANTGVLTTVVKTTTDEVIVKTDRVGIEADILSTHLKLHEISSQQVLLLANSKVTTIGQDHIDNEDMWDALGLQKSSSVSILCRVNDSLFLCFDLSDKTRTREICNQQLDGDGEQLYLSRKL